MKKYSFVIETKPIPKERPFFSMINAKPVIFTPKKTREFEQFVCFTAKQYAPKDPLEGSINIEIKFFFSPPKKLTRRNHNSFEGVPKNSRPDLDNLIKSILDGLNSSGFWKDDSQITRLVAEKLWTDKEPRIEIIISTL
jgi:Holliday junction resolvase RusA-like endonuclease